MNFVKLTKVSGNPAYVRYESINIITIVDGMTFIYLVGDSIALQVKEAPEEIFRLFKEAKS